MFHVPELARVTSHPLLGTTSAAGNSGAFYVPSPEPGWHLWLIASVDGEWEHVSAHADNGSRKRTPNWKEMVYVKDLCWDGEDEVIQFHPKKSEYVNCHPHVLHLWRPIDGMLKAPPAHLVGPVMGR